jgi:hypothetical protein
MPLQNISYSTFLFEELFLISSARGTPVKIKTLYVLSRSKIYSIYPVFINSSKGVLIS